MWTRLGDGQLQPDVRVALEEKIQRTLDAWEGTTYGRGQACRGVAVDCIRFLAGFHADMSGSSEIDLPSLPQDACMHDRAGAFGVMRQMIRILDLVSVEGGLAEPADYIVTGPASGGPGHGMIVGARPNELWHANGVSVCHTGIQLSDKEHVFGHFRYRHRHTWAPPI